MKKVIAVLLSLALMLSFAACGNKNDALNNAPKNGVSDDTPTTPPEGSKGGKVLVVYYSATNHTETAAQYIASATGADIFELVPEDDYTDDDLNYTDDNSRVVYEHDNPDARDVKLVKNTVDNWDEYDTVFIGYPIWWGIAAWPVNDFIKSNNFDGKTVIPFCTSASSGLGQSGELLKELAGTGTWLEGQRFSSSVSEDAVKEWVAGLNLD